ncbi:VC2046/SO_2500 family protein [Alishewanella longhuensis]
MQPIINEWQLDTKLNQALQQQHRADFALWLAVLSPAVNEMAAFYTPLPRVSETKYNLYQQLAVREARGFALEAGDIELMQNHSVAVQQSLAQVKLQGELTPAPWVWQDNTKKLDNQVFASLDSHCRRRLQGALPERSETDETGLYEMLQQLNTSAFADTTEAEMPYQ